MTSLELKRELAPVILIWSIALVMLGLFGWILGDILWHGVQAISWGFLWSAPRDSGREGGIFPILVSTGWILAVCLGVSFPLGLGTATLLSEFSYQWPQVRRWVEWSLDVLAGVPSIVFGLFGNVLFAKVLGLGFSILSGGLTLACMVLPILIRAIQQSLNNIPAGDRRAAAALGISKLSTFWVLLLPAAMPGIVVGLLLGFGRAIAETAALIFTSGYVDRMPRSVWDSGRSLSVHIYDLAMNVAGGEPNAYATAMVLILILVVTNTVVASVGTWFRNRRLQRV
ncbi:MAG: phosphate ABC transporter permease PstA [Cyanobacteria bacterium P01_F01_bin.42]